MRYLRYWKDMITYALWGTRAYRAWVAGLLLFVVFGLWLYWHQLQEGLVVTNMNDLVSWGIGNANFVYFVGIAASPVLLVVAAYINNRKEMKEVVIIGELFAFCAAITCLLFIVTDLGHPERMWHMIPFLGGRINLPHSILAWDVVAFTGYLMLSLHIPGYLLYQRYLGRAPKASYHVPFAMISVAWAVGIHTVTAFLLSGFGSRAFWNTAVLAPRFLVSALCSGPAAMILIFAVLKRYSRLDVQDGVFDYLKNTLKVMLPVDIFLVLCEAFKEFYTGSQASSAAYYLYFGSPGHRLMPIIIWTSMAMIVAAAAIFAQPRLRNRNSWLWTACLFAVVGIWGEKGMGMMIPGFTPSPLGEIYDYVPNFDEIGLSLAIVAAGLMLFTLMAKVAIAIQMGDLRAPTSGGSAGSRKARSN